ncbi:hypothetical protein [Novipirellula rosea]|uniref:hypothetical protein n=1 Tax=Novipirellula rosea TaxID=1031540 RepID=UPI0031EEBB49
MTDEWDRLANTERWRPLVAFIRNWVGSFDSRCGMSEAELHLILSRHSFAIPSAVCEWYQLSSKWDSHGQNLWIPAQELSVVNDALLLLTDEDGISNWGVMSQDLRIDDPPVVPLEPLGETMSLSFSMFVLEMVVNDVIFDNNKDDPAELSATSGLSCFASTPVGDFMADGPLESASVIAFAYPSNGPILSRSRSEAGNSLIRNLQGAPKAR